MANRSTSTRSRSANATRSTRSSTSAETTANPANALTLLADLPRRQLALMAYSTTALLRGTQEFRRIQQEAAQRALQEHEQAAERLSGPIDFSEMMSIGAELTRFDLQEASRYWQQLANAVLKLQADIVTSAGEAVVEGASEPTLESLQRAFAASLNGSVAATAAPH